MSSKELVTTDTKNQCSDFMTELGKVMDNPEFRSFFGKYMRDWGDIPTIMMIMKTYDFIDREWQNKVKEEGEPERLTQEQIIYILRNVMKDGQCRQFMVKSMNQFMDHNQDFSDTYRQAIGHHFPQLETPQQQLETPQQQLETPQQQLETPQLEKI